MFPCCAGDYNAAMRLSASQSDLVTRTSLLRGVCANDGDAWGEFFVLYEPLLEGYIRGRFRAAGDNAVDEIVATVWENLFRAMPAFKLNHEQGKFRTWLHRVTMNTATDYFRADSRRKSKATSVLDGGEEPAAPEPPDNDWNDAYLHVIYADVVLRVRDETEPRNPAKWRSYVEREVRGRPAQEIAKELGISEDSVYQNSSRVLKRICQVFQEALQEEGDEELLQVVRRLTAKPAAKAKSASLV